MLGFRIGERLKFHPGSGAVVFGTLTRYNKKTVNGRYRCRGELERGVRIVEQGGFRGGSKSEAGS
jgi:hypothetical protein